MQTSYLELTNILSTIISQLHATLYIFEWEPLWSSEIITAHSKQLFLFLFPPLSPKYAVILRSWVR